MSVRRQLLSGAAALTAGQAVGQALAFVRNIIIARLLSPDDLGIAATFALTMAMLEMVSDLAADKLLVQAEDGDDARLQDTAHLLQALRGLLAGAIIFVSAWPLAWLFDVPDARWAFHCLAAAPALRGLAHLDPRRVQRHLRYWPATIAELAPQLVATLAAWPLAVWIGSYAAVLWLAIGQAGAYALASHLVAQRDYRWSCDRAAARRMFRFGWPLIVNGLLMFGVFQGDRLIIGANYHMAALGVYSVAFTLALTPTVVLAKLATSLLLPAFAQVQRDPAALRKRYRLGTQFMLLVAAVIATIFIAAGQPLIVLLYGEAYAAAGAFFGWIAAMQALRLARATPTLAAMSCGDTLNGMYANIGRSTALLAMLTIALSGGSLVLIAMSGFAGELVAYLIALVALRRRTGLPLRDALQPTVIAGLPLLAAAIVAADAPSPAPQFAAAALTVLSVPVLLLATLPDLRREAIRLLELRRGLGKAVAALHRS